MRMPSARDSWDDEPVKLGRKRKDVNSMSEMCPVEETASFLLKSTMVPVMTFGNYEFVKPVKASITCSCCIVESVCKKRVANRLPAMCEKIFATDLYLIEKHDPEELKSLMVIRHGQCTSHLTQK